MTVRVVVADDEAVSRRRIRRLLSSEPDVAVVGECADGRSAVEAIGVLRPDLVFLDVQMPELDGFDVLQALDGIAWPAIVFVTAFDRYALKAFDVHAIDYLLKPFAPERFRLALSRARQQVANGIRDAGLEAFIDDRCATRRPVCVAVRAGARTIVISWSDVDWMEGADNYVKLHVGANEYLVRSTLATLEKRLDPQMFVRIHRSTIVRVARIAELRRATHGDADVHLRDGTRLALSRTFRERVAKIIAPPRRASPCG